MIVSVKVQGLEELKSKLINYRNSFDSKQKECLRRLAEIGIDEAKVRFGNAQYDGTNDVIVNSPQWISDNRIAITATGESVAFIEFGTGVFYSEQHPYANEMNIQRGTFGQGKGSQNTWGYYGEGGSNGEYLKSTDKGDLYLTHGNPPARAMYEASKKMQGEILRIVKEVFNFD